MGLFDGQGMGGAMPKNLAEMGRGVGQSLTRGLIDPYMESKGFISEENRILDVMKDVDLTNSDSYAEGFRKIMEISPEAATEFRAQTMPILQANLEGQALQIKKDQLLATTEANKIANEKKGTAKNRALDLKREGYIAEFGEEAGNEKFLAYLQGLDVETAAAGDRLSLGVTIFKTTMEGRDTTREKLSKISTGLSQFQQAQAGSAAAAEIAETLIAQIFEDKRQATSEIKRIASAGSLVENVGDFVNGVFSGIKTAEHYAAFIKTLQIYEAEQSKKYSKGNDSLRKIATDYGLDVPDSAFEVYTPPNGSTGAKIKEWDVATQSFILVDRK